MIIRSAKGVILGRYGVRLPGSLVLKKQDADVPMQTTLWVSLFVIQKEVAVQTAITLMIHAPRPVFNTAVLGEIEVFMEHHVPACLMTSL